MKKSINYFFSCHLIILCFALGSSGQLLYAQNTNKIADSLNVLLKSATDTTRVNLLNEIAYEYISDDPETATKYANEALVLSQSTSFVKGEMIANNNLGLAQYYSNNYDAALEYYNKVLLLARKSGDKLKEASAINNIGLVYDDKADYTKALENYLKALQIVEKINGKRLIASTTNNIALIYQNQGKYEQALAFHHKALKIKEEIKNTKGVGNSLHNIALVYKLKGDYEKSLEYNFKALAIRESVNDMNGKALTLNNIGSVYESMEQFDKARTYFEQSLEIRKNLKDQYGLAVTVFSLGSNYFSRKQYEKGFEYMQEAVEISKKIGANELLKKEYQTMAEVYADRQNFSKAYEYQKLFINVKDSILNAETEKQINELQTKYETEKKQKEIELITKNNEIQALELNKNKLWIWMLVVAVLLVFTLAGLFYNRSKLKQKANVLLEHQNTEITQQKKEITDSINYAKRIQESILPPTEHWKKLLPDSFIFYRPKDIVSGDFYWIEQKNQIVCFAAVDCTGHGVPGALMSVVGFNLLTQAVNEMNLTKPSEILKHLDAGVTKTLRQSNDGKGVKDGMDLSLCSLNKETNELQYAGAFNSLYYINNGVFMEIKADKFPIGVNLDGVVDNYTNHAIQLQKGDSVYLYSDGYADQFGGSKGKKFKYNQLKNLLVSIAEKPIDEQQKFIADAFDNWKGELEQIDDVLIIGVRV